MFSSLYLKLGIGLVLLGLIGGLFAWGKIEQGNYQTALAQKAVVQAALDQQVQVNHDNLVELAEMKRRFDVGMKVLADERAAAETRAKLATSIRERINRAPATDDGPIAPVLLNAIAGLRELSTPNPAPDQNTVGGSQAAGGTPPVPGQPPAN